MDVSFLMTYNDFLRNFWQTSLYRYISQQAQLITTWWYFDHFIIFLKKNLSKALKAINIDINIYRISYFKKLKDQFLKKMKILQFENSDILKISKIFKILLQVFFSPSFRFCSIAKIENSDLQSYFKKFMRFLRFPRFTRFSPDLFF